MYVNPYLNYPFQQNIQQPIQQPVTPVPQLSNQTMMIATEEEVLKYPIAPGNTIPFKIDGKPLIIEKSMGMSQFDSPRYERYKLVKEGQNDNTEPINDKTEDKSEYILKTEYEENRAHTEDDIKEIRNNIEESTAQLYDEIDTLKKMINRNRKKENINE